MSARPKVSVTVPTYNRLPHLREAVASVVAQTYPNWELIVVDDGSEDGTQEWIAGLDDPRIRLLALPHSGNLGHVRNRGIAEARGELVAFLDSDDAFEPRKLEAQVAALTARPECGWSYTALTRVDRTGAEIGDAGIRSWREISGWILEDLLRFDALVDTPTVMVRRTLLDQVGPLDEDLSECQDYDLFFRLARVSPAVAVPEALTRKRVHAGSLSGDRLRVHEAWIVVYERFGARSTERRVRHTCDREARRHRLSAAMRRAQQGDPLAGLAHVTTVLRRRPWTARGWRVLGSILLRPHSWRRGSTD